MRPVGGRDRLPQTGGGGKPPSTAPYAGGLSQGWVAGRTLGSSRSKRALEGDFSCTGRPWRAARHPPRVLCRKPPPQGAPRGGSCGFPRAGRPSPAATPKPRRPPRPSPHQRFHGVKSSRCRRARLSSVERQSGRCLTPSLSATSPMKASRRSRRSAMLGVRGRISKPMWAAATRRSLSSRGRMPSSWPWESYSTARWLSGHARSR